MKKARILSIVLALLMIFSTLGTSVSATAEDTRTQLGDKISEAEGAIPPPGSNPLNGTVSVLLDAIDDATLVYEDENATENEMLQQIYNLDMAIKGIVILNLDNSKLWDAMEFANSLKEEDYTPESYENLMAVSNNYFTLHFAQSQEEIDMATVEIYETISELVPVGDATVPDVSEGLAYGRFVTLIYEAERYVNITGGNYIAETYERLLRAYDIALEIKESDDAVVEQYIGAADELEAAIAGLEVPDIDTEAFRAVIESCENINKEDYTKESYDNFNRVYSEVIGVYYYGDTQEEIDTAKAQLEAAIEALVRIGETPDPYERFMSLMFEARQLLEVVGSNYAAETFERLMNAYNAGLDVQYSQNISNEVYEALSDELEAAIDGLVIYSWDTDELWEAIEKCEGINREDYTEESYDAFAEANHQAHLALYYGQSQEEVNTAKKNLETAIRRLIKTGDIRTQLEEEILYLEEVIFPSGEDYTYESIEKVGFVYQEACGLMENSENPTDEMMINAIYKIRDSVDALVPVGETAPASSSTESTEVSSEATVTTDVSTDPTEETKPSTSVELTETTEPTETSEATENSTNTAPTTEAKETLYFILGDADLNDKVNIKDATTIQKHLAKILALSDVALLAGDTTEDGKLNIKDATEIQKFLANLSSNESIGKKFEVEATPIETTAKPSETANAPETTVFVPVTTNKTETTDDELPTESTAPVSEATDPTESTASEKTEATTETAETTTATIASTEATSTTASEESLTLYFANTQNWENVNIHYWNDSDTTSWPGVAMVLLEINEEGHKVYTATVPADITGIVFNAGINMTQTVDIYNIADDMCYSPASQGAQHWEVEISEYTAQEDVSIDFEVVSDIGIGDYGSLGTLFFLVEDENDLVYKDIIEGDIPTLDTSTLQDRGKAIIVMLNSLSSGSNTQTIDELRISDDTLVISKTVNIPSAGTCDMNYRFVAIEVNKADIETVTDFACATVFTYEEIW